MSSIRFIAGVCVAVGICSICVAGGWADSYAIVVSKQTYADSQWRGVVAALEKKHHGQVIEYGEDVGEAVDGLKKAFPRYVCFVGKPEEVGRAFVRDVHRMMRRLDDDPYTDAIWAVLTGYDAGDALRIAKYDKPLVCRRVLTATVGAPMDEYDEGRMFNELEAGAMWEKAGGEIVKKDCPTDTTELLVAGMNEYKPDVFITSGHASERDWMIGYGYRSGFFKCQGGQLYAVDAEGRRFDINSPNPKVHLAVGNCLIGHVPDRECMALALMRTAGVYQMVGYTIPTSFGYGGWGVKDYFSELQAGRFTLAEAQYVNGLALVYELEKKGQDDDKAAESGRGLAGDRDVVVLYGDPAWQAAMSKRQLVWSQELAENGGVYTFTIKANRRGDWDNRPVVELLPWRVKDIKLVEGGQYEPVICDNFILVKMRDEMLPMKGNRGEEIPIRGDFEAGQEFRIVFKAARAE